MPQTTNKKISKVGSKKFTPKKKNKKTVGLFYEKLGDRKISGMKQARDAAAIIGVPLASAIALEVSTIDALNLQPKIKSKVKSAVNKIKKIDKALGGKITNMEKNMSPRMGAGGAGMFTQFGKLSKKGVEKIRQKLM